MTPKMPDENKKELINTSLILPSHQLPLRVGELVRLGKLTDFIFLGRKYVSMKEVDERSKQELKAGRPRRGIGKLATASLKAAVKTDSVQASPGGYAGSYFKKQREEANERRRREFQKKWRAVIEARRNERKS
ncbi:MAG: hypothetical protein DMF41_08960 [Verrucomicrobia bacterium]|nr:MAG: hypothetical protein DMF41_08960 [Verrucomicrobiota bacterium]